MRRSFYCSLLDWSPTGSLAVVLHDTLCLWDLKADTSSRLLDLNDPPVCGTGAHGDFVTSVSLSGDGRYLSVGTNQDAVLVWNFVSNPCLRS